MAKDKKALLIVEDDLGLQRQLKWHFDGFEVAAGGQPRAGHRAPAPARAARGAVQDLGLPPDAEGVTEGLGCLADILHLAPHTKVVVVTGHGDRDKRHEGRGRRRL